MGKMVFKKKNKRGKNINLIIYKKINYEKNVLKNNTKKFNFVKWLSSNYFFLKKLKIKKSH